jgi:hypothetical protein
LLDDLVAEYSMTRLPLRPLALAVLLVFPATVGEARIFLRTGGGGLHGATEGGQPGWTQVWEAQYRINGGGARVEALGCPMPVADALRALRETYRAGKGYAHISSGERSGWGFARVGDRVIRFYAIEAARPGECLVFRIEQSLAEFRASLLAPAKPILKDLPPPGEGRVLWFAANETSRTEFEIMASDLPAAAVERGLGDRIRAAGWREALPRGETVGGVRLVVRGGDVGLWLVRKDDEGRVQILRTLKRGAAP